MMQTLEYWEPKPIPMKTSFWEREDDELEFEIVIVVEYLIGGWKGMIDGGM